MSMASPRAFGPLPVCSQARGRLAAFPAGRAKRERKVEGKIKEHGTIAGQFWKLLLSAHWLGESRAAPCFRTPRAAVLRKALALQGFDRHHRPLSACFRQFWAEPRP